MGVHNITGYFDIYFSYQPDQPFWSGRFIMPLKQTSNVLLPAGNKPWQDKELQIRAKVHACLNNTLFKSRPAFAANSIA
ncbi:hypothetical protein BM451_06220 [Dickeya dadantii]|uniref:hypothetical protein n=1 Tax=Dickeya dadantii TaxID=204038 RepID=UPI000981456D|nr:hypothetical protein [Dickeya dadantii]OOC14473.1 hypothetical protein BM451_06220 [Dickeya dadantii]